MVRAASAALTARGARKAPRTSTAVIVARASSGSTSSAIVARPEDPQLHGLPGVPEPLEIAAAEVLGAERQRPAGDRVVHCVGPGLELPPDRRPDEVRAVGVEPLVDEEVDLAEVDEAEVDRDLLALVHLGHVVPPSR